MKIDPETKIGRLLGAIPSSAIIFKQFNVETSGREDETLKAVCKNAGIRIEQFLQALDGLDWGEKSNDQRKQSGSHNG